MECRRLNAKNVPDEYPLLRIDDWLDSLGDAETFMTFDCNAGYWQVPVAPEDRDKTTFTLYLGTFKYTRMPIRLRNAPATGQRILDIILREVRWQSRPIYLEDVIVFVDSRHRSRFLFIDAFRRFRFIFARILGISFAAYALWCTPTSVGSRATDASPSHRACLDSGRLEKGLANYHLCSYCHNTDIGGFRLLIFMVRWFSWPIYRDRSAISIMS